jgi:hypothetical protein
MAARQIALTPDPSPTCVGEGSWLTYSGQDL